MRSTTGIRRYTGELSAETLKFRGVRGAVVDGGCRDIDFLKLGFRVCYRYCTPADMVGRRLGRSPGEPVTLGDARAA